MAPSVPTLPVSLPEYLVLDPVDEHGNPLVAELVEGMVVVNPAPRPAHETARFELAAMLVPALPPGLRVTGGNWVVVADEPATVRIPDLAVVAEPTVAEPRLVAPLLVVEIVSSRSSEERDLVTKRREYAAAGCPHYWVLLPGRPELIRFRLDAGSSAYVEAGRTVGRRRVRIREPFPVTVDLARLAI